MKKWTAYLGNLFEHYDTALFGFLSPFLAPLIFPKHDPMTALILTYALIPLGMAMRPVGALVFGYIGDRQGRERALFLTLLGMGIVSGCMAFIPTYEVIGIGAPIAFCLCRVLQNFFAAGETMGGAVFLLEQSDRAKADVMSGVYAASTMGGHILASLGVFLWGGEWRLLYLCGAVTALIGALFRKVSAVSSPRVKYRMPLIPFISIVLCSGFGVACYFISLVLMNGLIPLISGFSKGEMIQINTYLIVVDFALLPFFGFVATKISRERLMIVAAMGVVCFAMPLFMALKGATFAIVVGVRMLLVLFGVAFFAPFHAWAQELVPREQRYATISFGYALGAGVLGSPTAAISLWFYKTTGMVASLGWYWMALGLLSAIAVMKVRSLAYDRR